MGIGTKLDKLIKENDSNANKLALAINESPSTIYSIIQRDNNKVDMDILQKIANYFKVTLDYFREDGHPYYANHASDNLANQIHADPNLRVLFDATKNLKEEDIKDVIKYVNFVKSTNEEVE